MTTTRQLVHPTSLGPLTLVGGPRGLAGVYFPGHWTRPDQAAWGEPVRAGEDEVLDHAAAQLDDYLAGGRTTFDVPLDLVGSPRARELWDLLTEIPFGRTTTYGALADRMGSGISARAVGGFVGHNPVSIIVPCHRVVGASGKLTGYAGGLERKQHLLELEGVLPPAEPALW